MTACSEDAETGVDLSAGSFHACALRAGVAVAAETGRWPPDSEATRRLAYRLYEERLREKHDRAGRIGQS